VHAIGGSETNASEALAKRLQFTLTLTNGQVYPQKGRLYSVDRQVNVQTGSITVQTEFANPGNVLRPGGFGRLSTTTRTQQGALLVPQRAVSDLQGAYLVAVVGADNKIAIRPVKPGARVGSMWVIDEGLKPGERIVAEGMQKVKEGQVVNAKPYNPAGEPAKPQA